MRPALQAAYAGLLSVALLPAMLRKTMRSGSGALHIAERFARVELPTDRPIWISAASVGETMAIRGLLDLLRAQYPQLSFFLSYSSEAARKTARDRLNVPVCAQPLDFVAVQKRFFATLKPRLCLLVEQELWPNMLLQAKHQNIPVVVVNGRMSAKSARHHARISKYTRALFASLTLVMAQSRADATRFRFLGAPNVVVSGNLKFDARPDPDKTAAGLLLREQFRTRDRPVLLLASTRQDTKGNSEEKLLLDALKQILPRCAVILVPRHPERCAQVTQLLESHRIAYTLHSKIKDTAAPADVIIGDTLGEMDSYIACADVVFIGASLVNFGGQNLMEPMAQGKPVVMGPHMHNFAELCARACRAKAAWQGGDAVEVAGIIDNLLSDPRKCAAAGQAGQTIARQSRGAGVRTMAAIAPILNEISN